MGPVQQRGGEGGWPCRHLALCLSLLALPGCRGRCDVTVNTLVANSTWQELTSPGYPRGSYPNNQDCWWTIVASDAGRQVVLDVLDMDTVAYDPTDPDDQDDCRCPYDYVQFYDGNQTQDALGKWCWYKPCILSKMAAIRVYFHSDDKYDHRGFKTRYRQVETGERDPCVDKKGNQGWPEECTNQTATTTIIIVVVVLAVVIAVATFLVWLRPKWLQDLCCFCRK